MFAFSKIGPKQLAIHDIFLIDGLEKLASGLHEVVAPAVIQISQAGGVALKQLSTKHPQTIHHRRARQLEKSELYALADDFACAAERAVKAVFDGVKFMGRTLLLASFFSFV
jgi:2,4-dienoyl-CoA reductase-like NADH-dependent reductase (Old Yellow Enzyme family)